MLCQSLYLCKRELKNLAFFVCFLFLMRIPGYPSGNSDDNVLLSGKFINKKEMVTSISVSPDCNNVAVATGKTIFIVPVDKKESMKVLLNNGNAIEEIKYSNTGKYLLVKDGKKTGYYDFNRNRMIIPPVDYYTISSGAQAFTVFCCGSYHSNMKIPVNRPQYDSINGLSEE
ncbi:MAG: hypothetical protein LWY06_15760, partial [Firmicutes bacterium]|nr:hypothetical protein [Bacillota bacterium]